MGFFPFFHFPFLGAWRPKRRAGVFPPRGRRASGGAGGRRRLAARGPLAPGPAKQKPGVGAFGPGTWLSGRFAPCRRPPRAAGCTQRKRVNPKEPVANQEGSSLEIGQDLLRVGIGLDLWQHLFHHALLVNDISGAHHPYGGFPIELLFLPHAVSFNGLALRVC